MNTVLHERTDKLRLEGIAEELLRCLLISAALDQNIQYVTILIYCTPQVMQASVDFEEHLIKVPSVAGARRPAAQAISISLTELEAPLSDGLVGEDNAAHR